MPKLRVAAVTKFPFIESDGFSGLPSVSKNLCDALARRDDVELHVISGTFHTQTVTRRQINGYTATYFPYRSEVFYYASLYGFATREVVRLLHDIKPDIVHCQAIAETALGSLWSGFPTVATIHGIAREERKQAKGFKTTLAFGIQALAEAYYVRRLSDVIACSPYVSRFVSERNPRARLYDISNPMDEAFFAIDAAAPRALPRGILVIGTVVFRKGHDLILEAMPAVLQEFPDATLTFVGKEVDPVFAAQLRARSAELGIGHCVTWLGAVSQPRLIEAMQQHQIVCVPSREETLPMSISQAAIVGNLPVASNAGGIPDMLNSGIQGVMFTAGDPADCARRLVEVMRLSPAEVADARRRNRVHAEGAYRGSSVAQKTMDVYRKILRESGVV